MTLKLLHHDSNIKMLEINEAYDVLSNDDKREAYNKIYDDFNEKIDTHQFESTTYTDSAEDEVNY